MEGCLVACHSFFHRIDPIETSRLYTFLLIPRFEVSAIYSCRKGEYVLGIAVSKSHLPYSDLDRQSAD